MLANVYFIRKKKKEETISYSLDLIDIADKLIACTKRISWKMTIEECTLQGKNISIIKNTHYGDDVVLLFDENTIQGNMELIDTLSCLGYNKIKSIHIEGYEYKFQNATLLIGLISTSYSKIGNIVAVISLESQEEIEELLDSFKCTLDNKDVSLAFEKIECKSSSDFSKILQKIIRNK